MRAPTDLMLWKATIFAGLAAMLSPQLAAAADFRLGVDYSRQICCNLATPLAVAVGADGFLYVLAQIGLNGSPPGATVLGSDTYISKLTPDGTLIWSTALGFYPDALAVDSAGSAYMYSNDFASGNEIPFVAKLTPDGRQIAYKLTFSRGVSIRGFAVDSSTRVYVAGVAFANTQIQTTNNAFQHTVNDSNMLHTFVVRFQPSGAALDYATWVSGSDDLPTGIAVDASGAATLTGVTNAPDFPVTSGSFAAATEDNAVGFVAKLSPDGSALTYSIPVAAPTNFSAPELAGDAAGNAVVFMYSAGVYRFWRYDAHGNLTASWSLNASGVSGPLVALDAVDNTYVLSQNLGNYGRPARHSLQSCSANSNFLTVFAPDGTLLLATWLGAPFASQGTAWAVGKDSSVYVVSQPPIFDPSVALTLTHLSQSPGAPVLQLACITDPVTYLSAPVAPGKIMSLFGDSLGPDQGAQPSVTMASGFPLELAKVQVTFDGKLAPMLYAQNNQINFVAPWSLTAGRTTNVCVTYNDVKTNCLDAEVVDAAPSVFLAGNGPGAAAINQDGTINSPSNPAKLGSTVSVFVTGMGPVSPPLADGAITGLPLPVNVFPAAVSDEGTIGNSAIGGSTGFSVPLHVEYAGPAPYLVSGVSQVNFTVIQPVGNDSPNTYSTYVGVTTPSGPTGSNPFLIYQQQ